MARCKSCDAPIVFVETAAGRKIPLNLGMVERGNIVIEGEPPIARVVDDGSGKFISHFATCTKPEAHRKPRNTEPHWSDK